MDCTVMVKTDTPSETEKQNVSVILVPESILLAFSKTTAEQKDLVKESRSAQETAEKPQHCESCYVVDKHTSEDRNGNGNTGMLSQLQQPQSVNLNNLFIMDTGDWFINANLTNRNQNDEGSSSFTSAMRIKPFSEDLDHDANVPGNLIIDSTDNPTVEIAGQYRCKFHKCNRTFNSEKDALIHSKSHEKSNVHECQHPGCPWSFSTPYKLKRHMASHQQKKSFKCSYPGCKISCSTSYNLKVHEKYHTDGGFSRCDKCNKTFAHKFSFQKHQRMVHNTEPQFLCTIEGCGKKFHTAGAQKMHLRGHAKLDFVCGVEGCGKRFKQPAVFREHYMSRHTQLRPFKCSYPGCTWQFTTRAKMRRHEQQTHTEERKYCCPVEGCKSRFFRQEHVKSHLRVHNPDNDKKKGDDVEAPIEFSLDDFVYYFCPYEDCGSLFASLVGAKQHIQKLHLVPANQTKTMESTKEVLETASGPEMTDAGASGTVGREITEKDKESCDQPGIVTTNTESILKTLMQVETNSHGVTNESPNEALPSEFSESPQVHLSYMPSDAINISLSSNMQSQMTSPTATIDPSQFLLEHTVFTPSTSVESMRQESEPMGFINLHQSIYSVQTPTADRFLAFNDCVQTVDPNAVMSIPSSAAPLFNRLPTVLVNCEMSDDDESITSDLNNNNNDTGGSARTDCNAYRKIKIIKKWNPANVPNCRTGSSHAKRMALDLDGSVGSFSFTEGEPVPEDQTEAKMSSSDFKSGLPDKHFAGSTINLSDLA